MNILYTPENGKYTEPSQRKGKSDKGTDQNQAEANKAQGSKKSLHPESQITEDCQSVDKAENERVQIFYKYNPDLPFFTQFPADSVREEKA